MALIQLTDPDKESDNEERSEEDSEEDSRSKYSPERNSAKDRERNSGNELANDQAQDPAQDPGQDPSQDLTKELKKDLAKQLSKDPEKGQGVSIIRPELDPTDSLFNPAKRYQADKPTRKPKTDLTKVPKDLRPEHQEVARSTLLDYLPTATTPYGCPFLKLLVTVFERGSNLVLRPDDVWLAIVGQVGRMLKGSHGLRDKVLTEWDAERHMLLQFANRSVWSRFDESQVTVFSGEPDVSDYSPLDDISDDTNCMGRIMLDGARPVFSVGNQEIEKEMMKEIGLNIMDETFRKWVALDFSTSTDADRIVAEVGLFGDLGTRCKFDLRTITELPSSIELLGTKDDWEEIHRRVLEMTKIHYKFGEWNMVLESVIFRIMHSFVFPDSEKAKEFWKTAYHPILDKSTGTVKLVSGWITTFNYWDEDGMRVDHFSTARLPDAPNLSNLPMVYGTPWADRAIPADTMPRGVNGMPVVVIQDGSDGHQHFTLVTGCKARMDTGAMKKGEVLGRTESGWWLLKVSVFPTNQRGYC